MSKPWFRPKKLGVGAVPITWEGWALTGAYILAVLVLTWRMVERPALAGEPLEARSLIVWGALILAGTVIFMVIAWVKTSEPWYWRWDKE